MDLGSQRNNFTNTLEKLSFANDFNLLCMVFPQFLYFNYTAKTEINQ